MRDFGPRTVTAAVYAGVVLVAVFAPQLVFLALVLVAAIIGSTELLRLQTGAPSVVLAVVFFVGLACLALLRQFGATAARPGVPPDVPVWLLLVVLGTWAADVVGYLVGSVAGRHALAPRLSPGKTWEGTIASFAAAALTGYAVAAAFGLPRVPSLIALIGIGPVGLAGDLLESSVKRRAGVKDSGRVLPGHGGILDRVDSLAAVAIFVTLVLIAWGSSQLGSEGGLYERF